jgi:L-asparaginase II
VTPPLAPLGEPLFGLLRQGTPEVVVSGSVCAVTVSGQVLLEVDPARRVWARSLLKPWQWRAMSMDDASIPLDRIALAAASHNGTPLHVDVAQRWQPSASDNDLLLPPCPPLGPEPGQDRTPSRWTHPCSGKHAALLHSCLVHGWDGATYTSTGHPFHERLIETLRRDLHESALDFDWAVDGCGLPTPRLTVRQLARLFAAWAADRHRDRLWEAFAAHPQLVGGEGRLDSALITEGAGAWVAKEGADGLLGLAVAPSPSHPHGLGLVVKVAQGWDPPSMRRIALQALHRLGIDAPPPATGGAQQLVWHPALGG